MKDLLSYLFSVAEAQGEIRVECVKAEGEHSIFRFPIRKGYIKGTEYEIRQKLTPIVLEHGLDTKEVGRGEA